MVGVGGGYGSPFVCSGVTFASIFDLGINYITYILLCQLYLALQAGSCNVTAEWSPVAVDLVQLQVANESDLPCLQSLRPLVGALATTRFPFMLSQKSQCCVSRLFTTAVEKAWWWTF